MSKLIKNWTYLLVSDMGQAIISFFVFMFLARKLDPAEYGSFNAIIATAALLSVFSLNSPSNQVVTREITLNPTNTKSIFNAIFPIKIISLIFILLAYIIDISWFHNISNDSILPISLIILANVLWDFSESIAFGHFITKITTIISLIFSVTWLISIILLPKSIDLYIVSWIYAILLISRAVIYLFITHKKIVLKNNANVIVNTRKILLMSLPFLWMRIVGTFGEQIPLLLLNQKSGSVELGYYAVGNRFVIPITMAVTTGLKAVFPFLTKLFVENRIEFDKKLVEGFTFIFIFGAIISAILTLSSVFWIPIFFGKAYLNAVNSFNYQAWFAVLYCFDLLLSTVLSSTYRQNTLAIITTIDILIIFPILYFSVDNGASGMAIAKLIGVLIAIIFHVIVIIRILKINIHTISFYSSAFFFIAYLIISLFVKDLIIKFFLLLGIFCLIYFIKESPIKKLIFIIIHKTRNTIKS